MSNNSGIPCGHPGCTKLFTDLIDFYRHSINDHQPSVHHPKLDYQSEAQRSTSPDFLQNLQEEDKTTTGDEYGYGCTIQDCHSTFATVEEALKHMGADHHSDNGFPAFCTFGGCREYFYTPAARNAHIRQAHEYEQDYFCTWPECAESFPSTAERRAHLQQSHNSGNNNDNNTVSNSLGARSFPSTVLETELICKIYECPATFSSRAERDAHVERDHNGGTSDINSAIPSSFAASNSAITPATAPANAPSNLPNDPPTPPRSSRNHGRAKKRCPECRKFYANLSSHIGRIHRTEKNFACPDCTATYFGAPELRKHCRQVHNKEPPVQEKRNTSWRCPYCAYTALAYLALAGHMNIEHPKRAEEEAKRKTAQKKEPFRDEDMDDEQMNG